MKHIVVPPYGRQSALRATGRAVVIGNLFVVLVIFLLFTRIVAATTALLLFALIIWGIIGLAFWFHTVDQQQYRHTPALWPVLLDEDGQFTVLRDPFLD